MKKLLVIINLICPGTHPITNDNLQINLNNHNTFPVLYFLECKNKEFCVDQFFQILKQMLLLQLQINML